MYFHYSPYPMGSPEDQPMKRRKTFPVPEDLSELGAPSWPPHTAEVSSAAISSPSIHTEAALPPEIGIVTFISSTGKKYQWPFDDCQKWQVMRRLIDCANAADPEQSPLEDGQYELYNSENYVMLKEVWERMVKPGDVITMYRSQQPQPHHENLPPPFFSHSHSQAPSSPSPPQPLISHNPLGLLDEPATAHSPAPQPQVSLDLPRDLVHEPEAVSSPPPQPPIPQADLPGDLAEEPKPVSSPPAPPPPAPQSVILRVDLLGPHAEAGASTGNEIPEPKAQPISFRTGGKIYSLPFNDCRTWEGMESCIKAAYGFGQCWGSLDGHIEAGAFELVNQNEGDDHVILPSIWESMVEPGWTVEMRMLPLPEPKPNPEFEDPPPENPPLLPEDPPPPPENPPPQLVEPAVPPEQDIYLPSDARRVDLEAERGDGKTVYYFRSIVEEGKYYKTERSEWLPKRRSHRGRDEECFLYTGKKTGFHFWTRSFPPPRPPKRKRGY